MQWPKDSVTLQQYGHVDEVETHFVLKLPERMLVLGACITNEKCVLTTVRKERR